MEYMLTFHILNVYVDKTQPHQFKYTFKQMLELCMHIQNINNKSDEIKSLTFMVKNTRHYYSATHWIQTIFSNIHKHDVSIHAPGNRSTLCYTLSEYSSHIRGIYVQIG